MLFPVIEEIFLTSSISKVTPAFTFFPIGGFSVALLPVPLPEFPTLVMIPVYSPPSRRAPGILTKNFTGESNPYTGPLAGSSVIG